MRHRPQVRFKKILIFHQIHYRKWTQNKRTRFKKELGSERFLLMLCSQSI